MCSYGERGIGVMAGFETVQEGFEVWAGVLEDHERTLAIQTHESARLLETAWPCPSACLPY
jgi:hypothetical protein